MFAVMWSAHQQSSRLCRMVYWGKMLLFSVNYPHFKLSTWLDVLAVRENVDFLNLWSTLQAVSLTGQIGCEGEYVEFLMVHSSAVPWAIQTGWPEDNCNHSTCLPSCKISGHPSDAWSSRQTGVYRC